MGWAVLTTRSGHERVTALRVQNQGFQVYRPRVRIETRTGHRVESLFDRYVFFFHSKRKFWAPVRSTRGVLAVLTQGDDPVPVPKAEIDRIRAREDRDGFVVLGAPRRFTPGQAVVALTGSFAGIEGVFACRTPQDRARVLYEILGRRVPHEDDESNLEAAVAA